MVDMRLTCPMIIVDAYWDHNGRAICPAAIGLSHHISPSGAIEFCPPLQFACDYLDETGANLSEIFARSEFLRKLREFSCKKTRGCIILEQPEELLKFMTQHQAKDSSSRSVYNELSEMRRIPSHDIPDFEIPEKSGIYRFLKKRSFFGFGAYG